MKILNLIMLPIGLYFGASLFAVEDSVPPNKTTETKPKDSEKLTEAKPDEGEKKSPFAPSTLMRMKAQKPIEDNPAGVVVPLAPVVTRMKPVLEGVLVKNNTVLASFRVGSKSIVLEPRNTLVVDDVKYTFIGYADEVATLRDDDGHIHDLRVVQQVSTNPPHTPEPNANAKRQE